MEEYIQQTEEIQPTKKSKTWIWILIILILIAGGIGTYFLLTGDSSPIASGGSAIPQPPALPS